MRIHLQVGLGVLLFGMSVAPRTLVAQTATQVVTFSVGSTSRVAIGNLAAPVRVAASRERTSRTGAVVAGTRYSVTTNEKNQKIAASIDAPVSRTLGLSVALGAPRGATSKGLRPLSTTPTDLVTGITRIDDCALPMKYEWREAPGAWAEALRNRVVTYTITAGL